MHGSAFFGGKMLDTEVRHMRHRELSSSERNEIKQSLSIINRQLKKLKCEWLSNSNSFSIEVSIQTIRRALLKNELSNLPSANQTLSLIKSFENDKIVKTLEGNISLRDALILSFVNYAKKASFKRSKRIAIENSLSDSNYTSDLEHEIYFCLCESMYHYDNSTELSTFFFACIKNWLDRCHRYYYAKITGLSVEAIHDIVSYTKAESDLLSRTGVATFKDIAESLEISEDRALRAAELSAPFLRADRPISEDGGETFCEMIVDRRSSFDDLENLDVLDHIRSILSSDDLSFIENIGMSIEERDVLRGGVERNFEWGWQSDFAQVYTTPTGKMYTKARIGQLYKSAILKCKSLVRT